MRKSLVLGTLVLSVFFNRAYGDGYLALGEVCMPGDTAYVCAPGLLCAYDLSIGYGYCMSDCSLAADESVRDDDSWLQWSGRLPFDWMSAGTGYLKARCVRSSCLNLGAGCTQDTVYTCAPGYYGKSTNGTTGCTHCPSDGESNIWGMGGFDITDCYIPAGESRSDETGTYKFSGDCYYSL